MLLMRNAISVSRRRCSSIGAAIGRNRRKAHRRKHLSAVAPDARDEFPLLVRIGEFEWPTAGQLLRDVGRRHLTQQRTQLAFSERLACKRTGCSADHEVCDIAVGEADRVGAVAQHRGEQSIYSGHRYLDHRTAQKSRVQMFLTPVHFAPLDLYGHMLDSK